MATLKYLNSKLLEDKELKEACECLGIKITRSPEGYVILSGSELDIEKIKEEVELTAIEMGISPVLDRIDEKGIVAELPANELKDRARDGSLGAILFDANHVHDRPETASLTDMINGYTRDTEAEIEEIQELEAARKRRLEKEKAERKAKLEKELEKLPPEDRQKYRERFNLEEARRAVEEEVKRREQQEQEEEFDPKDRRTWY